MNWNYGEFENINWRVLGTNKLKRNGRLTEIV
jgi:hypothetical protein